MLGVLSVVCLILGSAFVVAIGLRKRFKNKLFNLKSQKPIEDHDYVTCNVEPRDGHIDKNEGDSGDNFELKEGDDIQADKDRDYYFMDTMFIGEVMVYLYGSLLSILMFISWWACEAHSSVRVQLSRWETSYW